MSVPGNVCMHSHTASSVNLQQLIIFIVKYLQNICMYELCIGQKQYTMVYAFLFPWDCLFNCYICYKVKQIVNLSMILKMKYFQLNMYFFSEMFSRYLSILSLSLHFSINVLFLCNMFFVLTFSSSKKKDKHSMSTEQSLSCWSMHKI